jgi:hypothetical protein
MSRKTRKQKILAETHRQILINPNPYTYTAKSIEPKAVNSELKIFSYIRSDLKKTLIISSLFIIGEIFLAIFSKKIGW